MDYDAIARMALAFVLEDESWGAFIQWIKEGYNDGHASVPAKEFAETANVNDVRRLWVKQSPELASILGIQEWMAEERERDMRG